MTRVVQRSRDDDSVASWSIDLSVFLREPTTPLSAKAAARVERGDDVGALFVHVVGRLDRLESRIRPVSLDAKERGVDECRELTDQTLELNCGLAIEGK